jgi:small subunit ribosomal protein S6
MMNHYETVFILTPVLSEEQTKETVNKFQTLVQAQAELLQKEEWGIRKLAYAINKKTTGFYYLFEFKADPVFIQKLETEYKRDERVMRYITVKMDQDHIEFAERRRKKKDAK